MCNLRKDDSVDHDKQPQPGDVVRCATCGRVDTLYFCTQQQAPQNGRGQYLWQWTRCCGQPMKLV